MKKIILCLGLICGGAVVNSSYAQQTTETQQEVILTSIKPADGQPAVFANQLELEQKQSFKIQNIKDQILENRDNPEKVQYLREELWRMENAIVHQEK